MKVIMFENIDGTVGICAPDQGYINNLLLERDTEGELIYPDSDACIVAIAEKDCGGFPYEIVEHSQLPQDRTFRNAWKVKAGGADVDMPKARTIQMDRIREKRSTKWDDLDQEYMICDEQGDAPGKSEIAAQKQVLRDLPTTFDLESITDPAILKDTWPPEVL